MPTNEPVPHYYQEDEIDLKELFKILWLKKNLIIGLTLAITILAGVYAFSKTPTYEAEAYFELGHYKDARNQAASLMPINELINEINFFFNSGAGNSISVTSLERKIPTVKITAKGVSSEISSNKVSKVFEFIKEEEQKVIERKKHAFNLKLNENKDKTKREINTVNEKIAFLDTKISLNNNHLVQLNSQLSNLEDELLSADDELLTYQIRQDKRAILATIESLKIRVSELQYDKNKAYSQELDVLENKLNQIRQDKRAILATIESLKIRASELQYDKNKVYSQELYVLENKLKLLELESSSATFEVSELIGKINNSNTTTYPKKKLIVAVAFVAGFMLSIFLVFIMNAFRQEYDKATA